MEAPEKLYFNTSDINGILDIYSNKDPHDSLEYTRTEVFIDKAQDFFRQSHHLFGLDGNELYHFIEDFRKYMKGE